MPIKFSCKSCQQTLQVSETLAGKTVACPKCGNHQVVEAGNSFDFASTQNPYQSPAPPSQSYGPGAAGMSGGQMYPTQFDVGQVFKISFELWKQNLGILIGMTAVYFGISIGHSIVNNVLNAVMMNTNDQTTKLVILAITIVLTFIIWAVNIWITIGQIRISLNLLRGLPANFGQLFSGADVFLPVFGVSLLFGLGLTLGLLFLIIPGIIFALFYWPVYYFVLDKKLRVFESFNDSPQYTKINIANSFIIFLMGAGINLLGVLACCIGVIASMPLVIMLTSASYLAMTGQLNYNPNNQQNYVG